VEHSVFDIGASRASCSCRSASAFGRCATRSASDTASPPRLRCTLKVTLSCATVGKDVSSLPPRQRAQRVPGEVEWQGGRVCLHLGAWRDGLLTETRRGLHSPPGSLGARRAPLSYPGEPRPATAWRHGTRRAPACRTVRERVELQLGGRLWWCQSRNRASLWTPPRWHATLSRSRDVLDMMSRGAGGFRDRDRQVELPS
jgi:hypothetical protein